MATLKEKINDTKSNAIATNPYISISTEVNKIRDAAGTLIFNNQGANNGDATTTSDYDLLELEWSSGQSAIVAANSLFVLNSGTHYTSYWRAQYENYKTIPSMLKAATETRARVALSDATNFGDYTEWDGTSYIGPDYQKNGSLGFTESTLVLVSIDVTSSLSYIETGAADGTFTTSVVGDATAFLDSLVLDIGDIDAVQLSRYSTEQNTYEAAKAYVMAYGYVVQVETNENPDTTAITYSLAGNYPT